VAIYSNPLLGKAAFNDVTNAYVYKGLAVGLTGDASESSAYPPTILGVAVKIIESAVV
jgi:hypothetical protein